MSGDWFNQTTRCQLASSRGREPASLFEGGFEAELRECGVSGNKVRALRAVSEAARDGLLDTAELRALPHEERAKRLCAIRGIGRWTADMIGILHFLDPDIWPAGDVAAVGVLRRLTGVQDSALRRRPTTPRSAPSWRATCGGFGIPSRRSSRSRPETTPPLPEAPGNARLHR